MEEHIENNFLFESIIIQYNKKQTRILVYDTPLGKRFLDALKDNLTKKEIPLINYQSHKARIFPIISKAWVVNFFVKKPPH